MQRVPFDALIMRADQKYEVVLPIDDNPSVIALWSDQGYPPGS